MIAECNGKNKFADIAVKGCMDSQGQPYNMGLIKHCRRWREHGDTHAYLHYSSYLLDECDKDAVYEELGQLIFSDFLAEKSSAIGSFFSVLDDVSCLSKAARVRGDMRQYGRTLRLHGELWERGACGVEAGVAVVLARHGRFREAVANALHSRDTKDAFDILLLVISVAEGDDAEAIQVVADAMFECVKQMDNEGTRAHHVHRILYAVRLKNPDLALSVVPECLAVADTISDEFQQLVCNLFLVQQVAPLDLDVAEDISRSVTGAYFAGEEGETLLALAALGRDGEPRKKRIERLERLLQRASELKDIKTRLSTVCGLILELLWEQPSTKWLRRWQEEVSLNLSDVDDSTLSDVISDLLYPKPIKVNNASAPYHGKGEIGSLPARTLLGVIKLVTKTRKDVVDFLGSLVDLLLTRLRKVDEDERAKALEKATDLLRQLAVGINNDLGVGLLEHLESRLAAWEFRFEVALCSVGVASSWYELGVCEKAEHGLLTCVRYVEECKRRRADMADDEEESSSSGLDSLLGIFDETLEKLSGEYKETEEDAIKKEQESLTLRLASALGDIPLEHRLSAFRKIEPVLEVGKEDVTLGMWIASATCALADVDRDLAVQIAYEANEFLRTSIISALAKTVGEKDPHGVIEIIDSVAAKSVCEQVAENIVNLCMILNDLAVPRDVWEGLAERLTNLQWFENRTVAANICAIRIADWSTETAREVAMQELRACPCIDVPVARNLQAFLCLLDIIDGRSTDIQPVLAAWEDAEEGIGVRTRMLVRKRVAPLVAVQDASKVIELLKAAGELREDLDALSELVVDLMTAGRGDTARAVTACIDEVAQGIEEEERERCIIRFFENIAYNDNFYEIKGGVNFWEDSLELARGMLDEGLFEEMEKLHTVFISAVDPVWAISRWFERFSADDDVASLVTKRAVIKDPRQAVSSVSVLPDTAAKGGILSHLYESVSELNNVDQLEVPTPFGVMDCLESPEERGELFAAYIRVGKEWESEELLSRIRALSTPQERRAPLDAASKQMGPDCSDEIMEIMMASMEQHLHDLTDKEDTDEQIAAWAMAIGAVSIEEGLKLLKGVEDSFERCYLAETLLENQSNVEAQTIVDLCEGLDEYDTASFVKNVCRHIARKDADSASLLVHALKKSIDDDDREECLEAIGEAVFEQKVRRCPDEVIDEISGICDLSDQAKQLKTFFEAFEEGAERSIVRWERILDIIARWIEMASEPSLDYEVIEEIMAYAPDEACRRIALKPESKEKADAYRNLPDYVNGPADARLLDLAVEGYRQRIAEAENEIDRSLVVDSFLEHIKVKSGEWDTDTLDVFAHTLVPALSELANKGEKLDEIIVVFLRKITLDDQGLLDSLLAMLDNADQRRQARIIVAERAPTDLLEAMVCEAGSFTKSFCSGEKEAAKILKKLLSESLQLPLNLPRTEASADATVSCSIKAFELLMSSYVTLRPVAHSIGRLLIAEMMVLLHQVVSREGDAYPYLSLFQSQSGGLKAEDAGRMVGRLLTAMGGLEEEFALQDWEEITKFITKGESERSLPPILGQEPALFRGSEGCSFLKGLLSEVSGCTGAAEELVKYCLTALIESYADMDECLVDMSMIAEGLLDASSETRKLVSEAVVVLCEKIATDNDEARPVLAMLRIFLACNLFLPEYLLESIQWMRQGLRELHELTSVHGAGAEFFTCLTRVGYCLGRMVVFGQCDDNILAGKGVHIWHILLGLAEFEYNILAPGEDDTFEDITLSYCVKLESDLANLECLLKDGTEVASPQDGSRRTELARSLKSSLLQVFESESRGEGDEGLAEGVSFAQVLASAVGIAWKLGLDKIDTIRNELSEALCKLTKLADLSKLRSEDSVLELNEVFEFKLFVVSLSAVNRQEALRLVAALAEHCDKPEDFGLFDALLLQDPEWVFSNVERMGEEDKIAEKVVSLLERLSEEAPNRLESVVGAVQGMCERHDNWLFRLKVQGALGSVLAKQSPEEAGSFWRDLPEFWSRSNVISEMAVTAWEHDPMGALDRTMEIEIAQVRAKTVREGAKRMAKGEHASLSVEAAKRMLEICETLDDHEERFLAARDVILAALSQSSEEKSEAILDIFYRFLELFTSTSTEWLQLACLHVLPFLSRYFGEQGLVDLSEKILCSDEDAEELLPAWPQTVAVSSRKAPPKE